MSNEKDQDSSVENWLQTVVAPIFDEMRANPDRARSAHDVRAALLAEYKRAAGQA